MDYIDLPPITYVNGTITLPGSKSLSNRALLLSALAHGNTTISNLLHADDTQHMLNALTALGVKHHALDQNTYEVFGTNGQFPNKKTTLFLGNAGTALRSLTAVLAFTQGNYQLFGNARMHERPIGALIEALNSIDAKINYLEKIGFPPIHIQPANLTIHHPISLKGDISSQFLSALLIALPLQQHNVTIDIIGELISKPYIEMTIALMQQFGIAITHENWQQFHLSPQEGYQSPGTIEIEGDASSASYFLAAGVIKGGTITVRGIGQGSIQGDTYFAHVLDRMGATIHWTDYTVSAAPPSSGKLKAIDIDLNHMPDAAMTLAVTALFAEGTTTIRNIGSWRVKETDRLTAMATELRKVGAIIKTGENAIHITPPKAFTPHAIIDTYDDHRMAMCFSLVALGEIPIRINEPQCTNKTFPDYFKKFATLAVPSVRT